MIRFETEGGHSEYWYDSADVAKYINMINPSTGRRIGRNLFLELLRHNGYILKDSNQPSQYLVMLDMARWHMVTRRYKRYGMVIFHERAMEYFKERIANGRLAIGFEKRKKIEDVKLSLDDVC